MFEVLKAQGPRTGVWPLQGMFPEMPRREVADLKRQWLREQRKNEHILKWTQAGSVWAVDHADPDGLLEGPERALWAVRDLASHNELVWTPVLDKTAQGVRARLEDLFEEHGAPLVVKMDNGALAKDEQLSQILDRWGVVRLLSPPYTPEYNGSCEASIGWLKARTAHQASRRGGLPVCVKRTDREVWCREDCETARRSSNETSRPWGPSRPTPQQAWDRRTPVTPELRALFHRTLGEQRLETQTETEASEDILDRRVQAKIERVAITRTLLACGLLIIRRRSIPLLHNPSFLSRIS